MNGVITEERFQKLNYAQWLFHFILIMKKQKRESEIENIKIESLMNQIEFVGIMANPDIGLKILEDKKKDKTKEGIESEDDDLFKFMQEIIEKTPETVSIDISESKKTKTFLPTVDRRKKLGIDIKNKKVGE